MFEGLFSRKKEDIVKQLRGVASVSREGLETNEGRQRRKKELKNYAARATFVDNEKR